MNIKGKNPSLTTVMIGSMIALTLLVLTFSTYSQFMIDNNGSIGENFTNYYENLSSSSNKLTGLGEELSDKDSIIGDIYGFISTIVNVFIIGLDSVGKFFGMVEIFTGVLNVMNEAFQGFGVLIALLTTIVTVYIAMRYIQSARGNTQVS